MTDAHGVGFILGGLLQTTRDFARFGQMMLQNGQFGGQQIVPEAWVERCGTASAPTLPGEYGYGSQWWFPADAMNGEMMALGIYSQAIYINRARETVIVATATNENFEEPGVFEESVEMFRQIAAA